MIFLLIAWLTVLTIVVYASWVHRFNVNAQDAAVRQEAMAGVQELEQYLIARDS